MITDSVPSSTSCRNYSPSSKLLSSQNYLDIPYKAQYIGTLLRVLRLLSVERENSELLEMMAGASSLIVHQFKLQ